MRRNDRSAGLCSEIASFQGGSDRFKLDVSGARGDTRACDEARYSTPVWLDYHFRIPLLFIDRLNVESCRTTVHNWVQKADLQPLDGANPDNVAVDQTVIQLNDEHFWLYAAVDPDTNRLLHVKLSPTRNQAITEIFLAELRDKHLVDDAIFLVDSAPWLQVALHRHMASITDTKNTAIETASNVSFEN